MKISPCLNSEISYEIAKMGHFDQMTIADAGLPIPQEVKRIDLAVTYGIPSFQEVLEVVLADLKLQKAYISAETKTDNVPMYRYLVQKMQELQVELVEIPHTELKQMTRNSKCVIRTGECKPFCNIILESFVSFDPTPITE